MQSIDNDWQCGLEILKPSQSELDKGLMLHRELAVCENYGFLPKVYTSRLGEKIGELQARGMGWPQWKRKSRAQRVTAATRDAQGCADFFEVLKRSGICSMIQSVNYMGESLDDAIVVMASYRHLCNVFKDRVFQATCAEDIDRAKATGSTGLFFSLTGLPFGGAGSMADLDGLLDWVDVWYHMGIRFMHLGYNRRNQFADGCLEVRDGGLSDLGREYVKRMNKVGIVVDAPHSSPNSVFDAAAVTSRPILASHIGCSSIFDHPRCKSDAEIKAIADTGGYVGIVSMPGFLGPDADLNLLLRHIEHAVKVVGADHVAIGTDLGYGQSWPKEMPPNPDRSKVSPLGKNPRPSAVPIRNSDPVRKASLAWTNWPLITVGLVRMGLSDDDIAKLLGGNLRRVLRACRPDDELTSINLQPNR
jgi:membrane dipeptidase